MHDGHVLQSLDKRLLEVRLRTKVNLLPHIWLQNRFESRESLHFSLALLLCIAEVRHIAYEMHGTQRRMGLECAIDARAESWHVYQRLHILRQSRRQLCVVKTRTLPAARGEGRMAISGRVEREMVGWRGGSSDGELDSVDTLILTTGIVC